MNRTSSTPLTSNTVSTPYFTFPSLPHEGCEFCQIYSEDKMSWKPPTIGSRTVAILGAGVLGINTIPFEDKSIPLIDT